MERRELLRKITFGERVAELETANLARYFVETDQWNRIFRGDIDVIKGDKGAGKSAIYSLLINKRTELFDRRILLVAGEKPQGAPIFRDLITDPPTKESEFINLWKLYIAVLIAETARDYGINNEQMRKVNEILIEQRLLEAQFDPARLLKIALTYARQWMTPKRIEENITLDPGTGAPTFFATISPGEPDERVKGVISIDKLIALAAQGLQSAGFPILVLLDRLDVAFAETHELEKNALRALCRVYRDLDGFDSIKLKIFIRTDIWTKIVEDGFREASHITRDVVLSWSQSALLNLIIRRAIDNKELCEEFNVNKEKTLSDVDRQTELFY